MKIENFFCNSEFFTDIDDYCAHHKLEIEDIEKLPDDWQEEIKFSIEEPIETLCADWIAEKIDDGRFSEEPYHDEYDRVVKILNETIDFKKVNEALPKMYYPNGKNGVLTKKDLLENA